MAEDGKRTEGVSREVTGGVPADKRQHRSPLALRIIDSPVARAALQGSQIQGALEQADYFRWYGGEGCDIYTKALDLLEYRVKEHFPNPEVLFEDRNRQT